MRMRFLLAALAVCTLATLGRPAEAAMSAEDIGKAIAALFGVEVLRVVPAESDDGGAAYRVTFMNPGGDFNEAFQVNTILVDAVTGAPIIQFRHLPSGTRNADAATYDTSQQGLDVLSAGAVRR
jgi:hypothetical protein